MGHLESGQSHDLFIVSVEVHILIGAGTIELFGLWRGGGLNWHFVWDRFVELDMYLYHILSILPVLCSSPPTT